MSPRWLCWTSLQQTVSLHFISITPPARRRRGCEVVGRAAPNVPSFISDGMEEEKNRERNGSRTITGTFYKPPELSVTAGHVRSVGSWELLSSLLNSPGCYSDRWPNKSQCYLECYLWICLYTTQERIEGRSSRSETFNTELYLLSSSRRRLVYWEGLCVHIRVDFLPVDDWWSPASNHPPWHQTVFADFLLCYCNNQYGLKRNIDTSLNKMFPTSTYMLVYLMTTGWSYVSMLALACKASQSL